MSEKRGYCVNTGLRAEAQKWRLKFQKEALIKQKENEEIERKREAEQQLEQLRKEVQRKKEIEEKTRHYFDYNKYNRKVPADAYYFGDMEIVQNSWRPHGSGKVVVNDVPIVEGKFSKGDFYEGKIVWTDGSGWEGSMKDNMIHGVGFVVKEGERKPALAYEGKLICLREELFPGTQIEFYGPTFNDYGTEKNHPRGLIIEHLHDWTYICRFQEEVMPKNRKIDFGLLGRFKLLRGLPYIYDLQTIGIKTDCTKTYDYRSRLGHVAERDLQTKFPSRAHKDKRINMFESREIGIGAAREEDDMAEREKLKKLQWQKFVEERKAQFLADRQKQIEEEQAKIMESSIAAARKGKEEERIREEAEAKKALEDEASRFDESYGK